MKHCLGCSWRGWEDNHDDDSNGDGHGNYYIGTISHLRNSNNAQLYKKDLMISTSRGEK